MGDEIAEAGLVAQVNVAGEQLRLESGRTFRSSDVQCYHAPIS